MPSIHHIITTKDEVVHLIIIINHFSSILHSSNFIFMTLNANFLSFIEQAHYLSHFFLACFNIINF